MSNSPRSPIDDDDIGKIERQLEAFRVEAAETTDPLRLTRIESFIFTLETMVPVYRSFARFFEMIQRLEK